MKITELAQKLNAEIIHISDDKEIKCGYAGDFLSFVIGNAPTDCAWFTVMNNINVCAVATLAEVATIVLCEGVKPDEQLLAKVKIQGVNLIATKLDIYNAIKAVANEIEA